MNPNRSSLTRLAGWLVIILIPLILFARPILRGEVLIPGDILPVIDDVWAAKVTPNNPLLSDVLLQFYPWQKLAATTIAHGEFPLWNPFVLAGTPLLANDQSATFEPLRLFTLIARFPVEHSFLFLAIARLLLFGAFTALWLRRKEFTPTMSVISAGLAMLATPVVAWISYPLFATFLWFPLLLYGAEELSSRPRRAGLVLALATAAQWLSGNIQISVFLLIGLIIYVAVVVRLTRRQWLTMAMAVTLGTGLAAVQLFPAAEYIHQSPVYESGRGGYGDKNIFQAVRDGAWRGWTSRADLRSSIERLLPVVSPFINGNPAAGIYRFPGRDVYANFNELAGSIGAVGLLLALIGLFAGWRERLVRFAAGGSVLILGVIAHAPVFELLNYLPLVQRTQTDRLRLFLIFFVVILAAVGIKALLERRVRSGRAAMIVAGGLGFIAILGWKFGVGTEWKTEVVMAAISALAIMVGYWRKISAMAFAPLIGLAALIAPLWLLHTFNTSIRPATLYPASPVLEALQSRATGDDRIISFDVGRGRTPLEPNTAIMFQLQDVRGYDVVRLKRYDELIDGVLTRSGSHVKGAAKPSPILDALAVRYALVAARDVPELDPVLSTAGWKTVTEDERVRLYENPKALPRAYIATKVTVVGTAAESLAVVRDEGFDPQSPVLESNLLDIADGGGEIIPLKITSETANSVSVSSSTSSTGFLVLADAYAPGWTATVDGVKTNVIIADHALRAVSVPTGRHTVIFRYQPGSFRYGAWISLISLIIVIGWFSIKRRQ